MLVATALLHFHIVTNYSQDDSPSASGKEDPETWSKMVALRPLENKIRRLGYLSKWHPSYGWWLTSISTRPAQLPFFFEGLVPGCFEKSVCHLSLLSILLNCVIK